MTRQAQHGPGSSPPPAFDDVMSSLQAVAGLPRGVLRETRQIVAMARSFCEREVRPVALDLDRSIRENPDALPHAFVESANRWGLYTLWIPRVYGGGGANFLSLACFLEEVSAVCLALANLIGVHYLGLGTLSASYHFPLIRRLCREVAAGQAAGEPCLLSLAITEPDAGTDVEDTELVDRGRVTCHAKRVTGGYVLNGSKVFISSGHLSTWHITIAYGDLDRPSASMVTLAVKTGTPGFSFGRKERKMGQRACPASELVFRDCFVPDAQICFDPARQPLSRQHKKDIAQAAMDQILSTSRAGVGAFGAGVARGAYEDALAYAAQTRIAGRRLINQEWAQSLLADMYANAFLARLSYMESNYANALYGSFSPLMGRAAYYLTPLLPGILLEKWIVPVMEKPRAIERARRRFLQATDQNGQLRTSGWASLSKFSASDLAVRNCRAAVELMGPDGIRHDRGLEKRLRDARLLQIYEGTNQLNRLNLFKCMIGRDVPQARMFEEQS